MAEGHSAKMKTHLLLLGSTGHGKSSLGNLLVNPTMAHVWEDSFFPVGESRESCTRQCSLGSSEEEVVMDTPGLNESHQKDLPNMINVVKEARKLGQAHVIVLVMKMDSRMDQNYKDTVQYYYELYGLEACSSSLILVLTNFRRKDRQYAGGKGQAIVEHIVKQSSHDVKNFLRLKENPKVFCINSRPEDEEDLKFQLEVREKILNFARRNDCPANLRDLKVPKTAAVKQRHGEEAARLEGFIESMEKEKEQLKSFPPAIVTQYQELRRIVDKADEDINRLPGEIEKLDTKDLVSIGIQYLTVRWGIGDGDYKASFKSKVPIRHVETSEGRWKDRLNVNTFHSEFEAKVVWQQKRWVFISSAFENPSTLTAEIFGYRCEVNHAIIEEKRKSLEDQQKSKGEALEKMATIEAEYGNLPPNINVEDRLLSLEVEIRSLKTRKAELESTHFVNIEEAEEEAKLQQDLFAKSKL